MRVGDAGEKWAEAERQTEETKGREVGKPASSSPFHPTLSMCNLTCSADWLPAAAGSPEALGLAPQLALCWAATWP